MRRSSPLVLALLAVLAAAAPAFAADGDVVAAWASQNPALSAASASLATEMKKGERTRFRSPGRVVAAIKQIEKLNAEVRTLVVAQTASTPSGGRAREEVLRSVDGFAASLKALRRSIVAASKGRLRAARRLLGRAKRKGDAAEAAQTGAVTLFAQAASEAAPPPPPPPSDRPPSDPPPSDPPPDDPPPSDPPPDEPPPEEPPPDEPDPCEENPLDPGCVVP